MAKPKADKEYGPGLGKAKKIAIGIDQSYSGFGITFMDRESPAYKTIVFKAEGTGVDRLVHIQEKLGDLVAKHFPVIHAPDLVIAMEGYAFGSQMANMAGELGGLVKMWCYSTFEDSKGKYPYIIPPTVLKKYVTGKGTGVQKNQILLHVFKKWNIEFNDDNAADSYALAHMVAGKADLAYEREIYHKIQEPNYREK